MKAYFKSIKGHIFILTSLLFFICVFFMVTICIYLINSATENVIENTGKKIIVYAERIQSNLFELEAKLRDICLSIYELNYPVELNDFEKFQLKNDIFSILTIRTRYMESNLDYVFVCSEEHDFLINISSSRITLREKIEVTNYVRENGFSVDSWSSKDWAVRQINNQSYFCKSKKINDIAVLFMTRIPTLLDHLFGEMHDEQIVLALTDGEIIFSLSGESDMQSTETAATKDILADRLYVSSLIENTQTEIIEILDIDTQALWWDRILIIVILFSVIFIGLLLYLFKYLTVKIVRPINFLINTMGETSEGVLQGTNTENAGAAEITLLYNAYDSMIQEISDLKISEYENKLDLQKEKLTSLLHQVRPHFYLNAISTIYSMTHQHKDEDIRNFITYLAKHLRYRMKNDLNDVSLKEELDSCNNYIEMQKIRFPDKFLYQLNLEEGLNLSDIMIPPLLIHTVLENCFKHALNLYEKLTIKIIIRTVEQRGENFIEIVIEDNGDGFPHDMVAQQKIFKAPGDEKIGLENIRNTLALIYGRDDLVRFGDAAGRGAQVTILIPCKQDTTGNTGSITS